MELCSSFRGTSSWGDQSKMRERCVKKGASRVERTFRFCHFCISFFYSNACKQDCPSAFLTCSLPEISMNELALKLIESLPYVPPILIWSLRIVLSARVTSYCGGTSSKVSQINCMQTATFRFNNGTENTSLIRSTKRSGLIARLALTYSIHFHSGSHRRLSAKRMRRILYISRSSRSASDVRSPLRIKAQRTAAVCGNIQSSVASAISRSGSPSG